MWEYKIKSLNNRASTPDGHTENDNELIHIIIRFMVMNFNDEIESQFGLNLIQCRQYVYIHDGILLKIINICENKWEISIFVSHLGKKTFWNIVFHTLKWK